MTKKLFIQKITLCCIFITLSGCYHSNQKVWDSYNSLNSGISHRSSKTHSKYIEQNDSTDSNVIYTPSGAHFK